MRAYTLPRGGVIFVRGGRPVKLPLSGTLTRAGTILKGTSEQFCAAGDGTGSPAPVPPDCGTRRVRNAVEIAFGVRLPDVLQISDGDAVSDPYDNCPTGVGEQFPTIMAFDGRDRRIGRRLPASDLFGYGRNIVIARGTKRTSGGDTTAETTVRWTATLTRAKEGKQAAR